MTEVIVSSRPWHADMAQRLAKRTGRSFVQLGDSAQFTTEHLAQIGATRVFVPHWSRIIPADVFERFEVIVFHMTDLPFGRGGSPLQNLIVRGHTETVISALRCEAGLDTGPVYLKRPLALDGTAQAIFERASAVIADMIAEIVVTDPAPAAQSGEVTEFRRRKPADGDLSPLDGLGAVYDHIRMLDAEGYPPAFVEVGPWRIEFAAAERQADRVTARATIVRRGPQAMDRP